MSDRDLAVPALLVVTTQFPEPTETFIVREMNELRRQGFDLCIVSLRPPPAKLQPEAEPLRSCVVYPPRRLVAVLLAALGFVFAHPVATMRGVARAVADATGAWRTPIEAAKQILVLPLTLALAARIPDGRYRLHAHFAGIATAVIRVLAAMRRSSYSFTAHAWDIYVPHARRQLPARIADADFVATCTGHNRDFLRSLARSERDADKVVLCRHGLDLVAYRPERQPVPNRVVGGMRLIEKKGLHDLVAACAAVRGRGIDVECVLIGDGPDRAALEAQSTALGIAQHVRFTGWLPHPQVKAELLRAAVFAHPSIVDRHGSMDGTPNAILEAMALETPVVATRLSGIPEVVIPGETGLLVEPGDRDGLADALARLLTDPDLATRLGRAARAFILAHFDVRTNVAELGRLFVGEAVRAAS